MKFYCLLLACLYLSVPGHAQQVPFSKPASGDSILMERSMTSLAQNVLSLYKQDADQKTWLNNLFRLQMVAGKYAEAIATIQNLRQLYKPGEIKYPELLNIQYELYSSSVAVAFTPQTFGVRFTEFLAHLDDKAALYISTAFLTRNGIGELQQIVNNSLGAIKTDSISLREAISLLRNYNVYTVYKVIEPIAIPLLAADDTKRYIIQDSILIKTKDGAHISALLARRKTNSTPQFTILQFTIYAGPSNVYRLKEAANNGYVGVMAYTRGKAFSNDELMPYENDGKDVNAVIDWIIHQSWSNGKVAMYGGSYNGFTQWAATKKLHPALKTIVPSVSVAPGLDVPMTNNVAMSFVFPWTYYVSNNKYLDNQDYGNGKWDSINKRWYALGLPYRSLDSLTGRGANKIFQRWLQHPSYDKYWQNMIPYKEEFAHIDIPILTTTGYYDGGQIGAMYYFNSHLRYNKKADHYLLIGPWGHFGAQWVPDPVYNGYKIDPVANVSIRELIYQWFDYILKDSAKPAILKDRINFEVMDSNTWMHIPSLNKMSNDTLRFYLGHFHLTEIKPAKQDFIEQVVDFKNRTTMNSYYRAYNIIYDSLDAGNGITFISDPVQSAMNINGAFLGEIKASINKKDIDYSVTLYELKPDGKYFYLSYFMGRASYAKDVGKRQLLKPGQIEAIPFTNTYITSKKINAGSRIVIVLNINKSPDEQINYGTGRDVNDESIRDAGEPLKVKWYNSSIIKIPIYR